MFFLAMSLPPASQAGGLTDGRWRGVIPPPSPARARGPSPCGGDAGFVRTGEIATFRDEIRRLAKAEPKPTWILIAAEPVTDVDTTASDVLTELDEALNAQGISLVFAELK